MCCTADSSVYVTMIHLTTAAEVDSVVVAWRGAFDKWDKTGTPVNAIAKASATYTQQSGEDVVEVFFFSQ